MRKENEELLFDFLNTPLDSGDLLYNKFKELSGAVYSCGENPLERYVYVPGTRQDRVVLVAHIDTVWDKEYKKTQERRMVYEDGVFFSANSECGIGADDRAGCAMLWKLRDSGHSILIVDGEEYGMHGAEYLKKSNPELFEELNKHCFMIELDHVGTNHASFDQIDVTKRFEKYFCNTTGFIERNQKGGCDLRVLCKRICGVNVGVGYHKNHTGKEKLNIQKWENTYFVLRDFLSEPQKRYKSSTFKKTVRSFKRFIAKVLIKLKIMKEQ